MVEQFKLLPFMLRKQILIRMAGGVFGIVMFVLILSFRSSWQLILPAVVIALSFLASAFGLFCRCVDHRYVVISGTCTDMDRTALRKRITAVYLKNGEHTVKIVHPLQSRRVAVGERISVYVADNTPVYEMDGYNVICNVIAMGREAKP